MRTRLKVASAALALMTSWPAHAGGIYFSDRGVRPMGRAGAFVAGADDLGAIWYNPAGLVDAGSQLLLDAGWLRATSSFQRQVQVQGNDPNTGEPVGGTFTQTYPRVETSSPFLPSPTLAGSYAIRPDLVVAAGLYSPQAILNSYPDKLNGQPAPQRYSLISLDGSALSTAGLWLAYRPIKQVQFGLGPTLLLGTLQSEVYFSACVPDRFLCADEQPEYDAKAQALAKNIVVPSGTLGLTVTPIDALRLGASFQLPYFIDTSATLRTRLPSAAVFDQATLDGENVRIKLDLPWIARVGVEVRPLPSTRVEAAFVYERWSMHDRITVTPENITLRNVALFPPEYRVGGLSIPRNFQDAWSVRLGGEHALSFGTTRLDLRAGVSYEKSAVPLAYVSLISLDMNKVTGSLGAGLHLGKRVRLDATFALLFPSKVTVPVTEARITKLNPVRANAAERSIPINAGTYDVSAMLFGLGVVYQLGVRDEPPPAPQPTASATDE